MTVNVGRTIPRSVRLHALPVAIVGIAPAYRGYQYVVLEDETIVIVDPRTYVVVDVISQGGPGHATLTLTAADQRFMFTSLPKDRRSDVRVRLALGAEVPRNVELLPFPSVAVERIPSVQRYRYIVSGDDIVVVDPTTTAWCGHQRVTSIDATELRQAPARSAGACAVSGHHLPEDHGDTDDRDEPGQGAQPRDAGDVEDRVRDAAEEEQLGAEQGDGVADIGEAGREHHDGEQHQVLQHVAVGALGAATPAGQLRHVLAVAGQSRQTHLQRGR